MSVSLNLRAAIRSLRKSPGHTSIIIFVLALTTGVNGVMFSVIAATMLKPLPYLYPNRIFAVQTYSGSGGQQSVSSPTYVDLRSTAKSAVLAAFSEREVPLGHSDGARLVHNVSASDNFFDIFGVDPLVGRKFVAGEENNEGNFTVILSYDCWKQQFNGQQVLGRKVDLAGVPYTVIGVMPRGFRFPMAEAVAVYTPLHLPESLVGDRRSNTLQLLGRLVKGYSAPQVQAELNNVIANLAHVYPKIYSGDSIRLIPLERAFLGSQQRQAIWILTGAALAMSLIGCVNIAGLLLARGARREYEITVRSALGASRTQILREVLMEIVLLGLAAALASTAVTAAMLALFRNVIVRSYERGSEVTLNIPVWISMFGFALLVSIVFGILPALRMSSTDPSRVLKSGVNVGSTRVHYSWRTIFVVTQVGVALALLLSAGLLLHALWTLRHTDFGFQTQHLLTLRIELGGSGLKAINSYQTIYLPVLNRVQAIPGVSAAGLGVALPLVNPGINAAIQIEGRDPDPPESRRTAELRFVSPDWYAMLGVRLIQGRLFATGLDTASSAPVAVINEAFAREFFPGQDPLGKAIVDAPTNRIIIGVVSDTRQNVYAEPSAEFDIPLAQTRPEILDLIGGLFLAVRTTVPPETVTPSLKEALHEVAPSVPFRSPETMEQVTSGLTMSSSLEGTLIGLFAGIATLLALTGLSGLMSYEMESRRRDLALRMAFGASRLRITASILGRAFARLLSGIALGLAGAVAVRKPLQNMLFVRAGSDSVPMVCIVLAFIVVGMLPALLTALRAAHTEPLTYLRAE
jgi:putative ABC transport system permease protein